MSTPSSLIVAVIGLGEAGSTLARDLVAAGVQVRGWDPAPRGDVREIPLAVDGPTAIEQAAIILSVNTSSVARRVARDLLPFLQPGQIFVDLNAASPALKRELAGIVEAVGATFVDLELMAPVPGNGLRTPSLVSGSGALTFLKYFEPLGMPLTYIDAQAGSAAQRKLLRSIFMKGLAAAVIESMEAATRVGCADLMHQEIADQLERADAALLDRLINGSRQHAARRTQEMAAAVELLRELEIEPRIAQAAHDWLQELAQEQQLSQKRP